MKIPGEKRGTGISLMPILEGVPVLSCYSRNRGWHYVISWLHRFTGIGLIIILIVHVYALSSSQAPGADPARIRMVASPIFLLLAWASSLVVSFHALNGGRLLLYELFGRRNDGAMIRWVFGLSAAYAAMAGLMIILKNQSASPFFFWLTASFAGALSVYVIVSRMWEKRHSVLWKLQRISGAFLLITVPAYFLFSYLNPGDPHGTHETIARTEAVFTRLVFLVLTVGALYHAGYGLFSIAADYTSSGITRTGVTALIIVVIALLAASAFRLILSI